jgi:transposase
MPDKPNRPPYTQAFRAAAVGRVGSGQSIAATSALLGVSAASLGRWVKKSGEARSAAHTQKPATKRPEQREIEQLRAQVIRLQADLDLAKKAARFFARSTALYATVC